MEELEARVKTLLYLLMRDELPAGVVIQRVIDARAAGTPDYTNPHLAALADDLLGRLREPFSGVA
jgi:hypothetical protein